MNIDNIYDNLYNTCDLKLKKIYTENKKSKITSEQAFFLVLDTLIEQLDQKPITHDFEKKNTKQKFYRKFNNDNNYWSDYYYSKNRSIDYINGINGNWRKKTT